MTVTAPAYRTTARRHPGTLGAAGVTPRRPAATTGPFAPEPRATATVREWRGAADLARFAQLVPTTAQPETFQLQSRTARFGDFDATYMVHGPLRFEPVPANFGHPARTLRLLVVLDGEVSLRTAGAHATLGRRDGALLLGWAPVAYTASAPARVVVVDVPADHGVLGGLPDSAPFVAGSAETALLSALAAFVLDLLRQDADALTPAVRAQVTDSLDSLVSGVVSALAVSGGGEWDRRSQRMDAVRYIAAHYADPDLNPTTLATHLGISKRSLQRLFEGERLSVSQWIQAKRVDQVLLRLRDPRYASTSLEDLAVLTGFGSALGLRRAVQAATGKAPSAVRAEALTDAVALAG
ncbi:hypothetical protein DNL40_08080 [Xylanimonas oleitrophica]|uniref:HTH araC/xylS-type domain-containing protein n=1 Tax=Xylanimonas oleitrophica TaxID=2607479 RepID=A0A2W5Y5R6_9MICO|nr:AraC family transcriptional regulator [Xylanimonas oleitrophica]PZR53454.1 hypothetical protein DNL40_08080 [Xylanimonas oleitrophica]